VILDEDEVYREYLRKSAVAVIGGGSFGTVLANLVSANCTDVRMWVRDEGQARSINATRSNDYLPDLFLEPKVRASSNLEKIFGSGVQAVIWALPSKACRERARELARWFRGDEIVLHATKGVEAGSLKRISEVLREELPCPRIGVISGPNLADEIARGQPAATVVASRFEEVVKTGKTLLASPSFRVYGSFDMVGVEWAGTLKNVLAIAAGTLDGLNLGWNSRAMLMTRGLAEMARFGVRMGADPSTFLGLAGVGDTFATCSSPLSRNYRVGMRLARGESLEQILADLGSTAEGVQTVQIVEAHAKRLGVMMPITEGVAALIAGTRSAADVLRDLMSRPAYYEDSLSSR
jgi:glycerol-3-phosphate dehydrogenase (NAD(P)+)